MSNEEYTPRILAPVVNIQQTGKDVVIEAEMTGLKKEDISLDIQGDELTIKGVKKDCEAPKGYTAIYRERCPFEYSRTFILGEETKRDGITARYEEGILKVIIPKSEKAQPKKIEISD
jgi:HSP20 family protein